MVETNTTEIAKVAGCGICIDQGRICKPEGGISTDKVTVIKRRVEQCGIFQEGIDSGTIRIGRKRFAYIPRAQA